MARAKNLRRGLRKLECDCGAKAYMTWAQAETHGLPTCACGQPFAPEDLELAGALGLDAPVIAEYHAALSSVLHGQAWRAQGRGVTALPRTEAAAIAAARVEAERCARALDARLNALRPTADPMPF